MRYLFQKWPLKRAQQICPKAPAMAVHKINGWARFLLQWTSLSALGLGQGDDGLHHALAVSAARLGVRHCRSWTSMKRILCLVMKRNLDDPAERIVWCWLFLLSWFDCSRQESEWIIRYKKRLDRITFDKRMVHAASLVTLAQRIRPSSKQTSFLIYDTKQFDREAAIMLQIWGMRLTILLPFLPGPLLPSVIAPDRVLSMGQIELNCVLMLNWIAWNRTVYMNIMDSALKNYNGWYAIKPNQIRLNLGHMKEG